MQMVSSVLGLERQVSLIPSAVATISADLGLWCLAESFPIRRKPEQYTLLKLTSDVENFRSPTRAKTHIVETSDV